MEWIFLALGLLLIAGTGFFVAVEFSLVALDQSTVQRAMADGERGAEPLMRCLKSLSTQLSSCQLGITLTTLLTGFVMEPSVGRLLTPVLEAAGLGAGAAPVSLLVAMIFARDGADRSDPGRIIGAPDMNAEIGTPQDSTW